MSGVEAYVQGVQKRVAMSRVFSSIGLCSGGSVAYACVQSVQ